MFFFCDSGRYFFLFYSSFRFHHKVLIDFFSWNHFNGIKNRKSCIAALMFLLLVLITFVDDVLSEQFISSFSLSHAIRLMVTIFSTLESIRVCSLLDTKGRLKFIWSLRFQRFFNKGFNRIWLHARLVPGAFFKEMYHLDKILPLVTKTVKK